ncbi:zinc finger MYM-type protein 1-like [Panicum virgatum]|uniref:zinc finger MYM-type protein 1-like n=1 Tax=Panicum virgatum TaxID=38727 RepID=UPI0019D58C6E|nr:zinc finger MYM-type protein 1-like [Panicum virgatum]
MNQDQSIQVALDRQTDFTKKQNRIRLNTSIDSVRYLLRQGLAFRGHDESKESKNKGNFRELVSTLADQNEAVHNSIRNAPENCQWICGDIQKEITSYFAKITLKSIIEEIGGDVFSLLIDEASDASDKEQMAVVLRYLSKRGFIIERLVGVVHVKETSAICLKESLQKLFTDIGLSIQQVRGQCYDGASNMRGEFNGLKSKILQENRSAYYVHCFAHQLQLVIVAVAKKNEDISDFFYMISVLFSVVGGSCKRKDMIKEKHRDDIRKAIGSGRISTGTGLNQDQTLQRAGDTCWGSHYRTLSSIVKLFPAIVSVLKYVQKEGKSDKKSQARGLVAYFETFEFVFYLHMMLHILGSANTLSQSLQKKGSGYPECHFMCAINKN